MKIKLKQEAPLKKRKNKNEYFILLNFINIIIHI